MPYVVTASVQIQRVDRVLKSIGNVHTYSTQVVINDETATAADISTAVTAGLATLIAAADSPVNGVLAQQADNSINASQGGSG